MCSFVENGPEDIVFKSSSLFEDEKVTDLDDPEVKKRLSNAYRDLESLSLSSEVAEFVFAFGRFYNNSDLHNARKLFTRKQQSSSGVEMNEYYAHTAGGKKAIFNVLESSGEYHQ